LTARWTDREIKVIKLALADGLTPRDIAPLLPGRAFNAVEKRCSRLRAVECTWTVDRVTTLRQGIAAGMHYDELAEKLGISYGAVKFKARRMGLRLTDTGDRRRRRDRYSASGNPYTAEQRADESEQAHRRERAAAGDARFCHAMHRAIRQGTEQAPIGVNSSPGTHRARPLAGAAPSSGCGSPAAYCVEVA